MTSRPIYRIEIEGFSNTFETLPEVAAWVDHLKRRFSGIAGKTATVWQGQGTLECHSFAPGCPRRALTVSA